MYSIWVNVSQLCGTERSLRTFAISIDSAPLYQSQFLRRRVFLCLVCLLYIQTSMYECAVSSPPLDISCFNLTSRSLTTCCQSGRSSHLTACTNQQQYQQMFVAKIKFAFSYGTLKKSCVFGWKRRRLILTCS